MPNANPKFHGKKGRSGPRKGNINALRTGSRTTALAMRMVVGDFPEQLRGVRREARRYRTKLEEFVIEAKGEVNITDAHLIDTAAAATAQAGICRWLYQHKLEKMSVADIRSTAADMVKAKEKRDKAVEQLKLDAPPPDPWLTVDARIVGESNGSQTS